MPGLLDSILLAQAFNICNSLGKTYSCTLLASQSFDPDTGLVSSSSSTVSVLGSPPMDYEDALINEKDFRRGDVRVIVPFKQSETTDLDSSAFTNFVRGPGQRFTIDGKEFVSVAAMPMYSGENIAAYEYQLRS
tara:strand:+ start:776 stop:1177 length:402 start_codon:yes stop_codon:yes gene_type:complete